MKGIHRKGLKMFIYQVRIFGGLNWYVIRTYADHDEAASFAKGLDIEWDIKKVTLEEANAEEVNA